MVSSTHKFKIADVVKSSTLRHCSIYCLTIHMRTQTEENRLAAECAEKYFFNLAI